MKVENIAVPISLAIALGSATCSAFVQSTPGRSVLSRPGYIQPKALRRAAHIDTASPDDEVERLRSMAKKLREEASMLAAEQAAKVSESARKVFNTFDLNADGEISVEELKFGLEKAFKTEIPEQRVKEVLQKFDKNGDGVLQLEEFVSVDQMRNQLDALIREEKAVSLEQSKLAQQEEEAKRLAEMQLAILNDGEPTGTDKALSVLPYLFPLLDSLQYAGSFVVKHPDNILAQVAVAFYALWRSIPGGGFLTFFLLSILRGNPSFNRLVRFNMQQAILLDIALFFPGIFSLLVGFAASGLHLDLPTELLEISNNAVLFTTVATILYASASSLLGQEPDKIPLISKRVKGEMITPEMLGIPTFDNGRSEKEDEMKK